jgi:hypothetical protein
METKRLTKDQAAIIGAYTGIMCGPFEELHKKIEEIAGRPVFTHEMGDVGFMTEIRKLAKDEFLSICRMVEIPDGQTPDIR